jgi:uncharacterized membrane protein YccC
VTDNQQFALGVIIFIVAIAVGTVLGMIAKRYLSDLFALLIGTAMANFVVCGLALSGVGVAGEMAPWFAFVTGIALLFSLEHVLD